MFQQITAILVCIIMAILLLSINAGAVYVIITSVGLSRIILPSIVGLVDLVLCCATLEILEQQQHLCFSPYTIENPNPN